MKADVAKVNLDINTSFSGEYSPKRPYDYAEALLFVMFPFSGFHQVNYVGSSDTSDLESLYLLLN